MDADDSRPVEYTGYTGCTCSFHAFRHRKIQDASDEPFTARTEKQRIRQVRQFAEMFHDVHILFKRLAKPPDSRISNNVIAADTGSVGNSYGAGKKAFISPMISPYSVPS